jgi:hypothetical protein
MSPEERERWIAWEKRTGKCSACGHSHRLHNELSYCRSKTSHDGSGSCLCGMDSHVDRKLHLEAAR